MGPRLIALVAGLVFAAALVIALYSTTITRANSPTAYRAYWMDNLENTSYQPKPCEMVLGTHYVDGNPAIYALGVNYLDGKVNVPPSKYALGVNYVDGSVSHSNLAIFQTSASNHHAVSSCSK